MQNKEQDNLDNDFEEHISELSNQKNHLKKIQAYAIFAIGGLLLIILIIYFAKSFSDNNETLQETPKEENKDLAQSVKTRDFIPPPPPPQKTFDELIMKEPREEKAILIEPKAPKPRIVKGAGVTVVASSNNEGFSGGGSKGEFGEKPNTVFEFGQNGAGALQNSNNSQGGGDFVGEVFTPTIAKLSEFDQNLLLPKGTYIGCALKTKLVSSIKGGIACIVSNDVYSANGNTLLIEKGSTITGTFNAGQMDDGMDRIFVIWQEIRTPNNIVIPVYSGATDELGSSGMQGWVDHHYLKRFGSAILLSMIDDGMAILASQLNKGNNNNNNNNYYNYSENTRDNINEIASIALKKMIDIKPTLYKNQGDLVGVYVNRDIDFSKVYKLTRKKNVNNIR